MICQLFFSICGSGLINALWQRLSRLLFLPGFRSLASLSCLLSMATMSDPPVRRVLPIFAFAKHLISETSNLRDLVRTHSISPASIVALHSSPSACSAQSVPKVPMPRMVTPVSPKRRMCSACRVRNRSGMKRSMRWPLRPSNETSAQRRR
jgi:hypothetical protein